MVDLISIPVSNNRMIVHSGFILLGYLLGSVASAIVVCRMMGLGDPRSEGSGNPGATNVLRLYGKKPAALTLAGDVFKGLLPVLLARLLQMPDSIIALTGLAAFIGHLYPLYFRFQGGKGVATLFGVLSGAGWLLGLSFMATWLVLALLFRYSSLAAIIAAVMTPVYSWWLLPSPAYAISFSLMAAILIWRHRTNIRNLIAGTEDKIGNDSS